ncbi:MAG: hypothetical protein OEM15_00965 [Myxococcales bacterium]|nr:hypothetical protein [Myxococcales bacterium]MDH3483790.1 hypothetical protein [Myxococcales bacterium]
MSPAGRERRGRWIAVLVASLAAHLVALSALSVVPRTAAPWELNAIDVTFSVAAPPPRAELAVEPPEPKKTPPPDRRLSPKPPATSPTLSKAEPTRALDPTSVARAFIVFEESAPSDGSGADPAGLHAAAEAEPRNYFEGVSAKRYLSVREPPRLQRHQDGTHRYRGHAFKAIVERDGSVTFDDGYRQGTAVVFDITDAIMRRRGEDPYRVEKRWFLEGTVEFRQELFERWRAKQALVALRKLRGRLLRIIEDGILTAPQKATRVIAMFLDTADDEAGAAARNTIAELVAERMPEIDLPNHVR